MNITPVIPDGYNGPIKQLTCRICKHIFYLTMADYDRLQEVHYCHECSLILREELERNQTGSGSILTTQTPLPAFLPFKQTSNPVRLSSEQAYISRQPPIPVPQPRTIDRDKMTVAQLLEEAKMLDKTWRYKEALASYERALQCDQGCQAALYGKGEMLRQLNGPAEALAAYEEILRLDPTAVKADARKGWAFISLRRYEEALAAFDQALLLDPSASEPESGKDYIFTHIFHREPQKRAASPRKHALDREMIAKPCQSARDYYELGCHLIALDRDDEAFRAFARSIELDPLDLDVYEHVGRLYFLRENHEKSLATYNQALQVFPECAKLHEKRAEALTYLERHQEALDACNRAIQLDDTCASAYSQKGEILHQVRRLKEALDAFDLAISLNPDASTPYKQKASVLADVR
jgi:tetratricopeptide (TPR) repeat protein